MGSIIRSTGTVIYSLLYLNSRRSSNGLKNMYSVISVIVDSLPGNTENRESTRSWTARVRLVHSWADTYSPIFHMCHMTRSEIKRIALSLEFQDKLSGVNGFLLWIKLFKYALITRRLLRLGGCTHVCMWNMYKCVCIYTCIFDYAYICVCVCVCVSLYNV